MGLRLGGDKVKRTAHFKITLIFTSFGREPYFRVVSLRDGLHERGAGYAFGEVPGERPKL
jgi:hypothetical protein